MCEGMARVGNGVCLMAATAESIIAKSAKLLRASRTHLLTNTTITWGTDFVASNDVTSQTAFMRQAPSTVPSLYSGNRFVAFAVLKHPGFVVPKSLTVKACNQDGGGEVILTVPVENLAHGEGEHGLIHILAARQIIQDMDDTDRKVNSPATKSAIIHLGEQYQLASRYTSFVAVDDSGKVVREPLLSLPPSPAAQARFGSSSGTHDWRSMQMGGLGMGQMAVMGQVAGMGRMAGFGQLPVSASYHSHNFVIDSHSRCRCSKCSKLNKRNNYNSICLSDQGRPPWRSVAGLRGAHRHCRTVYHRQQGELAVRLCLWWDSALRADTRNGNPSRRHMCQFPRLRRRRRWPQCHRLAPMALMQMLSASSDCKASTARSRPAWSSSTSSALRHSWRPTHSASIRQCGRPYSQ